MWFDLGNRALAFRQPVGPPIAIVGNGRSGTSWIGRTVGQAAGTLYYREPCHPRTTGRDDDTVWSRYVPPEGDDPHFRRCLQHAFSGRMMNPSEWDLHVLMERLGESHRIVVKEVATFFSLEWLYRNWRPAIVIVVRHPCPSVRSVQRLGLAEPERRRYREIITNPLLVEQFLEPHMARLRALESPLEISAAIWAIKNMVALSALPQHPEWNVIRYEDVCLRPVDEFRALFKRINLTWSLEIEQWLNESTTQWEAGPHATSKISRRQVDAWRNAMSVSERDTVRRVVEPFGLPFYQHDQDW